MAELLSVQEARDRMLAQFLPVQITTVPIERALGMILSQDIVSDIAQPPFTNSGMDGFAVQAADTVHASPEHPVRLPVVMDIPAGAVASAPLEPGQTARIMTGAPVPDGADAIVPIEDTNLSRATVATPGEVLILHPAKPGAYLRPAGQDFERGQVVLKAGRSLKPQDLGLLASLGYAVVPVFRRPRLALLSSGDELISPSEPLRPGKIRDTNSYALAALAEQIGIEVLRLGIVRDDPDLIRERLEIAVDRTVDLIVTSAGVSVGAFDFVRQVIEEFGELAFWRVNMRPGKPVAFGSFRGIPLIGLPGNPVSAYVGFQVFVMPVLRRLGGQPSVQHPRIRVTLDEPIQSDGRESYLRGNISEKCGKITATLEGHQGSGNLFSLTKANALLILPGGVSSLPAGSEVDAWMLDDYWLTDEKAKDCV